MFPVRGEKKPVYENGCNLNLMVWGGAGTAPPHTIKFKLQPFSYTGFFSPLTGNIHQGHLHKGFPQREMAITIWQSLCSLKKKHLCPDFGINIYWLYRI